jgi:hypothetical protein
MWLRNSIQFTLLYLLLIQLKISIEKKYFQLLKILWNIPWEIYFKWDAFSIKSNSDLKLEFDFLKFEYELFFKKSNFIRNIF